ncbi:MAG: tetratricopeptide repeat protein [Psychrobacter celer]
MLSLFKHTVLGNHRLMPTSIRTTLSTVKSTRRLVFSGAVIGMLSLSACQTVPSTPAGAHTSAKQTPSGASGTVNPARHDTTYPVTQAPIVKQDGTGSAGAYPKDGSSESANPLTKDTPQTHLPSQDSIVSQPDVVILTPSREDYMISEPAAPSHNELLERARKNSQQRGQSTTSNNSDLPAFRNLMQAGISQLKAGSLTNAENSFTRAQRLAPRSSAVYFYLAQVALKKNQPRKAEAMARRGLSVSQDASRRRALWQVILQSGQAQGNVRVINEAKRALR